MSRPTTVVSTEMSINVRRDLDKLRECLSGSDVDVSDYCDNSSSCSSDVPQDDEENSQSQLASQKEASSLVTENSLLTSVTSISQRPEEYMKHHSLEAALVTNEMYQEALGDAVVRLQIALLNNQEKQVSLQSKLDKTASETRSSGPKSKGTPVVIQRWYAISAPYFKDFDGFPCPENIYTKTKRLNKEISPYIKHPRIWSDVEKETLCRAVRSNIKKNVMQPFMQRLEILSEKLSQENVTEADRFELNQKVSDEKEELAQVLKLTDAQLLEMSTREVDWMKISVSDFEGEISPENCELMWLNSLHPSIYKGNWTKEEDAILLKCSNKHGCRDWDAIAKDLGSKRTAEQCIKRYNEQLNPDMNHKGPWSEEENSILKSAVQLCRSGDKINFNKVSSYLQSRHPYSIRQHWFNSIEPTIKKGHWLISEDLLLLAGVKKFGTSFNRIAPLLPGRTYQQCRERYTCCLNWNVRFDSWSAEEDQELIRLAKEHGPKWALLSDLLDGRTPNMVMNRHARILAHIPDAYELIDVPDFEWPKTLSHTNLSAMERRRKVYALLKLRANSANTAKPGKDPYTHRSCIGKSREPLLVAEESESRCILREEFDEVLKNPKHMEFVLKEASTILTKPMKPVKHRPQEPSAAMVSVDNALDSLLYPSLTGQKNCVSRGTAFTVKQTLEFDHARVALYNALNVDVPHDNQLAERPTSQEDITESAGYESGECVVSSRLNECDNPQNTGTETVRSDSISSSSKMLSKILGNHQPMTDNNGEKELNGESPIRETAENSFKMNKMELRDRYFSRTILETISSQCLGPITAAPDKSHSHILPPMRSTVQAFKLLVLDRPRLAQVASQTIDISLIHQITQTVSNEIPKCVKCQSSNNVSNGKKDKECTDCLQLQKLHSKYVAFKNRFLAMFFWPGLMSVVVPPSTNIDPSGPYFIPLASVDSNMKRKRKYNKKTEECADEPATEVVPEPKRKRRKKTSGPPTRTSARHTKEKNSA